MNYLNWGTGIAIFYIGFMAMMIGFVVKSKQYDHSLVVDNYYEEDLTYQSHYDKISKQQISGNLQFTQKEDFIELAFAKKGEGTVLFYRPADKSLDFQLPIQMDSKNKIKVPTKKLKPGLWKLKCNWRSEGSEFYKEINLSL